MYNELQKKAYLDYIDHEGINSRLRPILTNWFQRTEPWENQLGKDLCEWTTTEILDFYKSLVNRSLESLMMIHSRFRGYARWCLVNARIEDSQNHFDEIDREILNNQCVNAGFLYQGIVTRQELMPLINSPKIQNAYERFLLLGLFEGIGGSGYSDFHYLTMDDFEGHTVKLKGRQLEVSDELLRLARLAANEYEYFPYGDSKRTWLFSRSDARLIKRKDNKRSENGIEELSDKGFRHIIALNIKKLSDICETPAFSQAMLFESGRLHMIKEFMKQDGCDAEEAIRTHEDTIIKYYGKIYGRTRYLDKWSSFLQLTD